MRALSPTVHGILDYAVVIAFAVAPSLLRLTGVPSAISYVLAVVHLLLTLATASPLGAVQLVPLPLHGAIELVVSIVLVGVPWILRFSQDTIARDFYIGAGALIFVVWLITDYRSTQHDTIRR